MEGVCAYKQLHKAQNESIMGGTFHFWPFFTRSICQSPIFNSLSHSLDPFTVSGLYLLLRNYNTEDGDFDSNLDLL